MNFFSPVWRERIAGVCVLIVLLVGSFAIGRFTAAKPTIKTVTQTQYVDRVHETVKEVQVKAATETKVVYRDRFVEKDGTVHEHVVEKTEDKSSETDQTAAVKDEVAQGSAVTTHTETSAKQQWHMSLLAGAQLHVNPLSASLAVGAHVERRIAGPFFLGAWALVQPQAPVGAAVGLSLGLEF